MEISQIAIQQMDRRFRTTFINSLPGYKCLQLVGTTSESGHSNVGIFNSIFHLGTSPALLGMIFRPDSNDHDTLKNIQRNGTYTFNNVTEAFYQEAHQTSARYPRGCSEFVECGLTEFYAPDFKSPFVAESTIKIAMRLREVIPIQINNTTMVIGEVEHILHNKNFVGPDGYIDHRKAETITVNGLDSYFNAAPIARLSYAKPDQFASVIATS